MRRALQMTSRLIVAACVLLAIGCENKDVTIKQLQEENEGLVADLDAVRADLVYAQDQLEESKTASEDLQSRLAQFQAALDQARKGAAIKKEGDFTVLGPGLAWMSIPGSVLFDPGKSAVKTPAKAQLNGIASQMRSQYAGRDIFIIGHTDADPIKVSAWKDNFELSCQRALSVARHLVGKGVPPARVVAAGCGQHRPVADNRTDAGKSRNRRVEIFAVSKSFGGAGK